jgi:hypothetical protein
MRAGPHANDQDGSDAAVKAVINNPNCNCEQNRSGFERAHAVAAFFADLRQWQLSVTLTFQIRQISTRAAIGALQAFVASIGKKLRIGIDYAFMVELQDDGTPHLHGLLVADRLLCPAEMRQIQATWHGRYGHQSTHRLRDRSARFQAASYIFKSFDYAPAEALVLSRGLLTPPKHPAMTKPGSDPVDQEQVKAASSVEERSSSNLDRRDADSDESSFWREPWQIVQAIRRASGITKPSGGRGSAAQRAHYIARV